jgi:mevalonate kinase
VLPMFGKVETGTTMTMVAGMDALVDAIAPPSALAAMSAESPHAVRFLFAAGAGAFACFTAAKAAGLEGPKSVVASALGGAMACLLPLLSKEFTPYSHAPTAGWPEPPHVWDGVGHLLAHACGFGGDEPSEGVVSVDEKDMAGRLKRIGSFSKAVLGSSTLEGDVPTMVKQAIVPLAFLIAGAMGPLALSLGLDVTLHIPGSTLPVGAGLGSSAALAVAAASSLLWARDRVDPDTAAPDHKQVLARINQWAFAAETLFHGTPSGLDNSVATHGGVMVFQKEPAMMMPLAGASSIRVVIVNTNVPKNTKQLVSKVRSRREKDPAIIQPIIMAMDALARRAASVLSSDDSTALGELVATNHALLNGLGVGHAALDLVVSKSLSHSMPAKLTGAGGGGCAFVLVPPRADIGALVEALAPCDCFETTVGGEGVRWTVMAD